MITRPACGDRGLAGNEAVRCPACRRTRATAELCADCQDALGRGGPDLARAVNAAFDLTTAEGIGSFLRWVAAVLPTFAQLKQAISARAFTINDGLGDDAAALISTANFVHAKPVTPWTCPEEMRRCMVRRKPWLDNDKPSE